MRIVEEFTIQRCRACETHFEIAKEDCIVKPKLGWIFFRCQKCERLNELFGIPQSFRGLLRDA
jgi:predicted RNA-binding Zn-ribbon protein involved in translation (DUF1610 family)